MPEAEQTATDEAASAMLAALKATRAAEHWENYCGCPNPALAQGRDRREAELMRAAAIAQAEAAGIKAEG